MNLLELPLTLVIKTPNQKIADTRVECHQEWTVKKLKQHLSDVYPSKPKENQQKIIYSGKLLADDVVLKDVLYKYSTDHDQTVHTVHLVCSQIADNAATVPPASSSPSLPSTQSVSQSEGIRHRHVASTPVPATVVPQTAAVLGGAADAMYAGNMYPMLTPGLYSPEQMMWMQQMYTQQMAHYMQYVQQGYPADFQNAPAAPEPLANQNAAPINGAAAAANQDAANNRQEPIRMNAQGGPVLDDDEDEDGNRDWLDWVYTLSRFGVLLSIVYFYSTISRFVLVFGFFFMVYAYQAGWLQVGRRQRRQQQQQAAAAAAQQPHQVEEVQQPQAEMPGEEEVDEATEADGSQTNTEQQQEEEVAEPQPGSLRVAWSFFSTFFTSLIPQQPVTVQAN